MKEKLIEWMKRSSMTMHYLRLIAGGYIVYLGWCNISGYFKGETEEGLLIGLSVFLTLCGAVIMGISLYALRKHLGVDKPAQNVLFGSKEAEDSETDTPDEE